MRPVVVLLAAVLIVGTYGQPVVAAQNRSRTSDEQYLEWWITQELSNARQNPAAVDGSGATPVGPLVGHSDLRDIARDWSDRLVAEGRFEHNADYARQMCCWRGAAEVLARVTVDDRFDGPSLRATASDVVREWFRSSGHRQAVLNGDYDEVGVGVAIDYPTRTAIVTANLRDRDPGSSPPGSVSYRAGDPAPAAPPAGLPCPGDGQPWGEPATTLETSSLRRLSGSDRVGTALRLADDLSSPDTVLLASSAGYADSLASSGLAGTLGAPVLLTSPAGLDRRVADRLRTWEPTTVLLLGGSTALSDGVVAALHRTVPSAEVVRLRGSDRFETAAAAARHLADHGGAVRRAVITLGSHPDDDRAWPDAVTVSGLAAAHRHPVLLTLPHGLPAASRATLRALRPDEILVVGGPASVSDQVLADARAAAPDATVRRVHGPTRYDTSWQIVALDQQWRGGTPRVVLTTGHNWPDALAAGPSAARRGALLMLIDGRTGSGGDAARLDPVRNLLSEHWRLDVSLAGGERAISGSREAELRALLPCL